MSIVFPDGSLLSEYQKIADLLTEILAIDGSGSGIDADKLDGSHASAFLGVSAKAADTTKINGKYIQFLHSSPSSLADASTRTFTYTATGTSPVYVVAIQVCSTTTSGLTTFVSQSDPGSSGVVVKIYNNSGSAKVVGMEGIIISS